MKKLAYRIFAYVLDLILVSSIVLGLSMISFINPNRDKLDKMYSKYNENALEINNINSSIDSILEDSKISMEEYNDIVKEYKHFVYVFDDITLDEKISKDDIESIKSKIEEKSISLTNSVGIEVNKLSRVQVIISLIVYVLYFGVLQYFMNGQTPFKRMFRIKVVDNKVKSKKVSLFKYIIRALLVSEILLSLADLSFVFLVSSSKYVTLSYWLDNVKYLYEMAFLVTMVIRNDQRSVDDLLLNTRVIRYDSDNKEIVERLFEEEESSEVKTKSKTKEVVKAEKVND